MAKTVKLSEELVEIANEEGRVMRRSTGAQVEYWARIGRRIEASGAIAPADIRKLLGSSGEGSDGEDDASLSALTRKLEALDGTDTRLLDDLRAGGHPIASEDSQGNVVIEEPRSETDSAK